MPDIEDIASRYGQARDAGDYCPEWLPGALTLDEALAVQCRILERSLASGETLAGWKVGLTSPRARAALGADVRPFGFILAAYVVVSGGQVDTSRMGAPAVEPELCFTFGASIAGPDVTVGDVHRAIARVSAGYEINERRRGSARPDLPAMVADRLTQWGIVVGDGRAPDGIDVNGIRCDLRRNGELVYSGVSRDELDDHFESIRRLVAGLAAHGRGIEAGQHVITGAYCRFDAAPGQTWQADYDGLGRVEVSFI